MWHTFGRPDGNHLFIYDFNNASPPSCVRLKWVWHTSMWAWVCVSECGRGWQPFARQVIKMRQLCARLSDIYCRRSAQVATGGCPHECATDMAMQGGGVGLVVISLIGTRKHESIDFEELP